MATRFPWQSTLQTRCQRCNRPERRRQNVKGHFRARILFWRITDLQSVTPLARLQKRSSTKNALTTGSLEPTVPRAIACSTVLCHYDAHVLGENDEELREGRHFWCRLEVLPESQLFFLCTTSTPFREPFISTSREPLKFIQTLTNSKSSKHIIPVGHTARGKLLRVLSDGPYA